MRSSRVTPNTVATPNEWNALHEDARGASRLLPHQMYGTIALPTNPTNGKILTLDINGTNIVITFVSSIGTTPGNVLIGATASATAASLLQLLQNPTLSTSTQVAIGANTDANVTLTNYIAWSLSGTSIIASSNAFSLYAPDTSFSASTNVTGGSYSANTLALYIEPGVVYVNGTRVYFTGGTTPTVTAPSSHPRVDVLSLDNTGTLNWTTGTEASSPTTPTYPANQVPICELYNVVGETALYDQSNQHSGQGYIQNDVRPFLAYPIPLSAIPDDLIPDSDGTRNLGSPSKEWSNLYVKSAIFLNGQAISAQMLYAATAAESVAAGAALAAGYYQSDGGAQIDFINTYTPTGSSGVYSQSLTIGNNANRILYVFIAYRGNTAGLSADPQFNGVSLTPIENHQYSHMPRMYAGILVAPATGTHNLTFTNTGGGSDTVGIYVASLYQCAQSGQPDNFAYAADDGLSPGTVNASLTPASVGDFVICSASSTSVTGAVLSWEHAGTMAPIGLSGAPYGDANKAFPLVPITAGTGASALNAFVLLVAIAPVTAATLGAVVNASASNTAAAYADNFNGYRSSAFIGFAAASAVAGAAMNVVVGGAAGGLSALISGAQYYLANTGGTIATAAGTVTRKIGIAVSATQVLITNLW